MLNSKVKWVLCLITGKNDTCELVVWLVCEGEANKEIDFCLSCKENSD